MDDVLPVRVAERVGDPRGDRHHPGHRQQCLRLGVRDQILALEQLHGDEAQIMLFAGIVDGDDVRMIEPAGGFGLAEETRLRLVEFIGLELL